MTAAPDLVDVDDVIRALATAVRAGGELVRLRARGPWHPPGAVVPRIADTTVAALIARGALTVTLRRQRGSCAVPIRVRLSPAWLGAPAASSTTDPREPRDGQAGSA